MIPNHQKSEILAEEKIKMVYNAEFRVLEEEEENLGKMIFSETKRIN